MGFSYKFEDVKGFIESNSGCKLISEKADFKNSKNKLNLRCTCGEKFKISFNQFKNQNKRQCNKCSAEITINKNKEKNNKVIEYINGENGNGCTYINGIYENQKSKLKIKCACNELFITDFVTFKHANKKQCNKCGFKRKGQSNKVYYDQVVDLLEKYGCKLLTLEKDYTGASQQLEIECGCGNKFKNTYTIFKSGKTRRCNDCYRKDMSERKLIPYEDIKYHVEIDSKSGCRLITTKENYINSRLNIEFQCKCGDVFTTSYHEFKSGNKRQCNGCGIGLKTIDEFLKVFTGDEMINRCTLIDYEQDNGYIYARSSITLKCYCGETFETKRYQFERGKNKCDMCSNSISKGEERIRMFLSRENIDHEREYLFSDCRGMRKPLPFDFAVFNKNKEVVWIIEFDGKQHFEPVNFGGCSDESALLEHENLKRNDIIKNKYCEDNNIALLRIPYWDFDNIESILHSELNI